MCARPARSVDPVTDTRGARPSSSATIATATQTPTTSASAAPAGTNTRTAMGAQTAAATIVHREGVSRSRYWLGEALEDIFCITLVE